MSEVMRIVVLKVLGSCSIQAVQQPQLGSLCTLKCTSLVTAFCFAIGLVFDGRVCAKTKLADAKAIVAMAKLRKIGRFFMVILSSNK